MDRLTRPERRLFRTLPFWPLLALLLIAVKAAILLADPLPRLFMGDSASYIHAALVNEFLPDRSYFYAQLIRLLAVPTHSLLPMLIAQSTFGVITALLCAHVLVASFGLRMRYAALLAVVMAIGPEQLFFERMLMAESAGTCALMIMLAAGFAYLRSGRIHWLLLLVASGLLVVTLRMSLLPVVLGLTALPPLLRLFLERPSSMRLVLRIGVHLVLVICATGLLHVAYKRWYGHETGTRPDYIAYSGYFRLGLVLPLVTDEVLRKTGLPENLADGLPADWRSPRAREAGIWGEDGIVSRLTSRYGTQEGNRYARKLAARATREDPIGFLRLSLGTLSDNFDRKERNHRLMDDIGNRDPNSAQIAKIRDEFGFDSSGVGSRPTLTREYFIASAGWLTFCLFALAPLGILNLVLGWPHKRPAASLLALVSIGLFLNHALFSHIVSFRYLHAFPLLIWLNLGAIIAFLGENYRLRKTQ